MKYPILNIWLHLWGTTLHKLWVLAYCLQFSIRLIWRALKHDLSKYSPTECAGFFRTIHELKTTTYGTPEYKALLDQIKPSLDHHYSKNSHHPEFYENGLDGFNLYDLVELWCDWKSAVRRHTDGNINASVTKNKDRFKISGRGYIKEYYK